MIHEWVHAYHEELERQLHLAMERMERDFPKAEAAARKEAIDRRLRENIGLELASACWWSWLCGVDRYEPRSFLFRVVL